MELVTKQGIVISINSKRRYGFILSEEGERIFFHATGVISPDFDDLRTGHPVEFFEIPDNYNKTLAQAIGVTVV